MISDLVFWIYYFPLCKFFTPALAHIFSLEKSPQISRTQLSILADLNNTGVWMVSTRPLISNPFNLCTNPLVTAPRTPIRIGITVTFMFHSFSYPLARSRYLSFFSFSFNFTLWSAGAVKFTIQLVLILLLTITSSGRLAEIKCSICISKSQRSFCV